MKLLHPGPGSLASLLLVTCGGEVVPPCDRLGQLCSDDDVVQRLDLTHARGATADLDGDGVLDLLSAGPDVGLGIAWGYAGQRDYQLFPGGATDVRTGDIDGDGDSDVVFTTVEPGTLRVLVNNGTRQPADGPTLTLAGRPQALWLGQLDADASLDAVVASGDEGTLTVITDGLTRAQAITVGRDLTAVEVGDVDGDGRLDLVAVDRGDAGLYVVRATGSGFAAPQRITTGLAPAYLQLLDFDGDGSLDALTHGSGPQVWFHAGDGAGGFAAGRGLTVQDEASEGFGAHRDAMGRRWLLTVLEDHLTASELDETDQPVRRIVADGILKVHGIDMDHGSVLTRGSWLGELHSLAPAHLFTELWHSSGDKGDQLVLADLDLDLDLDLAVAEDHKVKIYKGLADNEWTEHSSFKIPNYVRSMAVADVTGDGLPDLVIGDGLPSVRVAVGSVDGSFTLAQPAPLALEPWQLHAGFAPLGAATAVVVGMGYDTPGAFVLRFDAAGNLSDQAQPIVAGNPTALAAADLDQDGFDDLVALVYKDQQSSMVIVPGLDGGGWGPARARPLSALLPDLDLKFAEFTLGDLDLDGSIDAVLIVEESLVRLPNIGADTPPPPVLDVIEDLRAPKAVVIADADQDGRPDITYCTYGELRIVRISEGGELRPEAPLDQVIPRCALHVDPKDLRATAATVTDRGVSVLTPDFAPTLARTATFSGSPISFERLTTGDIDADGHTDIIVSDVASQLDPGFTVLWGNEDGLPRRATWQEGRLFSQSQITVAPLDDRPGDEIVAAWSEGVIDIWAPTARSLQPIRQYRIDLSSVTAVGIQRRTDGTKDIIVIGSRVFEQWTVAAVPHSDSGPKFIEEPAVDLWTGMAGTSDPTLTIADFDGDGYDDIVVFPGIDQPVQLLWGDEARAPIPVPIAPDLENLQSITSADMDGDGTPELLLGTDTAVLAIDFNHKRTPKSPVKLADSHAPSSLLVADLESDGRPDILRSSGTDLNLVLRAPGDTTYVKFLVDPGSWSALQAAALDGDGVLDFLGLRDDAVRLRLSAGRPTAP